VGFVNGSTNGKTDGYTMTLGHEWHEMMSDTYPNTAWNGPGGENSDECAWIQPGQTGGAANVSFGSFGSYAEQASWSNDTNGCAISHQILTHGGGQGNTVTVTNPGNQSGTVGTAASLQIKAGDSASGQTLTYTATGLPAGLSISSAGLISGTPTTAGTDNVTVTAKDTTGASGNTSFTWTVSTAGGGGGGTVTVTNPGSQVWITGYQFGGLQIKATDSKSLALKFTATGLPAGMTISATGDITGTPTTAGTYTVKVTATDTGGGTGNTTFTFTIYGF
jgi:serine protease